MSSIRINEEDGVRFLQFASAQKLKADTGLNLLATVAGLIKARGGGEALAL
jgi:hypothetical protein